LQTILQPTVLSYDEITDHLTKAGAEYDASGAHGIAAGLLSTSDDMQALFLGEILPNEPKGDVLANECLTVMIRLIGETQDAMGDQSLGFEPLLPADDTDLAQRALALREWCEGYLFGLGLGEANTTSLPESVSEAINDIAELTRMDLQAVTGTEEEEKDFAELVEFARVASLLIREELIRSVDQEPSVAQ
jgi:hypothetical protein